MSRSLLLLLVLPAVQCKHLRKLAAVDLPAGNGNVECTWNEWGPWIGCLPACGPSKTYRLRHQAIAGNGSNVTCSGKFAQLFDCGGATCPEEFKVNCEWSEWSQWSSCLGGCGTSTKHRQRHVIVHARNGGRICEGKGDESKACDAGACAGNAIQSVANIPLNVESPAASSATVRGGFSQASRAKCTWEAGESWSGCLPTCGASINFRVRQQVGRNQSDGDDCVGQFAEMQDCMGSTCPEELRGDFRLDCEWSDWSSWSACLGGCGTSTKHRQRHVMVQPRNGGKNCEGKGDESEACDAGACPTSPPQSGTITTTSMSSSTSTPTSSTTNAPAAMPTTGRFDDKSLSLSAAAHEQGSPSRIIPALLLLAILSCPTGCNQ